MNHLAACLLGKMNPQSCQQVSVVAGVENSGARHAEQFLRLGFSPNISYLCSIAHLQLRFNSVLFSFFPFNSCYVAAQPSWPVAGRAPQVSVQSLWQLLEDTLRKCELRYWGHPFPMMLIQPSRLLTKWTSLSTVVFSSPLPPPFFFYFFPEVSWSLEKILREQ